MCPLITYVHYYFLPLFKKTYLFVSLAATFFVIWFYWRNHQQSASLFSEIGFFNVAKMKPFFKRFEATKHLNCDRFFKKQDNFTLKVKKVQVDLDTLEFNMSCQAITERHFFSQVALSSEEANFPLAFARVVYNKYLFIEADLASIYAPQNSYCFSIDLKADQKFKHRIHALSNCFPNIFYTKIELDVNNFGRNMDASHFECLKILRLYQSWNYVVLLQNDDFAIKTNAEMVQIFQWLEGANDVEINPPIMSRINKNMDFSFKGLNLFKNISKNTNQVIAFAKGYNECSLTRAAVNYIFDELNIDKLISQLNNGNHGSDETLIPTLHTDDAVGLPGGIPHRCIKEATKRSHFTRKSIWQNNQLSNCPTHKYRHSICILGTEILPEIDRWPHLFGNKFFPQFDYGAFECMRERLYHRAHGPNRLLPRDTLDKLVYKTHVAVRYNRERKKPHFNVHSFACEP